MLDKPGADLSLACFLSSHLHARELRIVAAACVGTVA